MAAWHQVLASWCCLLLASPCGVMSQEKPTASNQAADFPQVDLSVECEQGLWGSNCQYFCRCLYPGQCAYGICLDYQCDYGYTSPPLCQEECDLNHFGTNCQSECHCAEGQDCNKVNGLCLPDFICDNEWTGAACQVRRSRLVEPPDTYNVSCGIIQFSFRRWSFEYDVGDPPVGNYEVYKKENQSEWTIIDTRIHDEDVMFYYVDLADLNIFTEYSFRVRANQIDNGKTWKGLMSPASKPVIPHCIEPTTTVIPEETTPVETTTKLTTVAMTTTEATTTVMATTELITTVPPDPPVRPSNVTVSVDDTDRVFVHWTPPSVLEAPLIGYMITYQRIGIGDCDDTALGVAKSVMTGAMDNNLELLNLTPYTKFLISVRAINAGGQGDPIEKVFITPETAPTGAVSNLGHTNISASSVIFTWDPVPCSQRGGKLERYDVIVREIESKIVTLGAATSERSFLVSDLKPYTTYGIRVIYVNAKGAGPSSAEYQVRTTQSIPNSVRNITISVDQDGRVYVHWNAPPDIAGPLSGYNLTYQKIGIGDCDAQVLGSQQSVLVDGDTTSVSLPDLQPWSSYRLLVRALNSAGASLISEKLFVTPETEPSGVVENVRAIDVSTTGITFTWDPVPCAQTGGVLLHYNILIHNMGTNTLVVSTRTTDTAFKITELIPFTKYGIRVQFVNKAGDGPMSAVFSATTSSTTPASPKNLRLLNYNDTSITVAWDPPAPAHGDITQFRVMYRAEDDELEKFIIVPASSENTKTIGGLREAKSYSVYVEARSASGWGTPSESIVVQTEDGTPERPQNLVVLSQDQTCIELLWEPPAVINGELQTYKVTYRVLEIQSQSILDPSSGSGEVPASTQRYRLCELVPAALFELSVAASTRKTYGPAATVNAWTEIGLPERPPAPLVVSKTQTTVVLTLQATLLTAGPTSGFFLIVSKLSQPARKRKRREVPDPQTILPIAGYTTAELTTAELSSSSPISFTVGDNKTYGRYWNRPLEPGTTYNIYLIVASQLDGVIKMSNVSLEEPVTTSDQVVIVSASTDLLIIILPAILGLLLLIAIIIIICCMCRNRNREPPEEAEKADMNATWLDYYSKKFNDSFKNGKQSIWSDIKDLNQSRHLTINEDKTYDPEDLQVTDIQDGKPKISFDEEYRRLPQNPNIQAKVAERAENREKNRFDHILAYDHSRVVLKQKKSGYINANYINGYQRKNAYIAAQSPFNDKTIDDFWSMVYQEKVSIIVFLARLEEDDVLKSVQYWPEDATIQQFGSVVVRHVVTEEFCNFVARTFDVYRQEQGQLMRRIQQFQFTAWPNHGVPVDPIPFLEFRMKVKTSIADMGGAGDQGGAGPLLVHCGTGVSRTAVFIAVDSLMEQAKVENAVNVYKFVYKMRRNRPMMVRTLKQYVFIYNTLFEALITNYNIVGEDLKVTYRLLSNTNPVTDKSYFREQFEMLEDFTPKPSPEKCTVALREVNIKKNRFETIVPTDDRRVVIQSPGGLNRTDYINALFLDSYVRPNEFIVTQTPLSHTVVDFWKMVYDFDVNCIVMLNNSDFKEETCAQYWPKRKGMEKIGSLFVNLIETTQYNHVTVRELELYSSQRPSEEKRQMRMFQYESWRMYEKVPWSRESFIELIESVELWREETDSFDCPVLVHCMDGASQSGLYCACVTLCEKIGIEEEVDVFHTIKHLKRIRPHFINSLEQYKFCFKMLWDYLNTRIKGFAKRSYEPGDPENGSDPISY